MATATLKRTRRATETQATERRNVVTVTKAPGVPHEVETDGPISISAAFRKAGITSLARCDITAGGKPAKASDRVRPGTQVVASPRIKGG